MDRPRVVIIGSGNVATHLARSLAQVSRVEHVCSTHIDHAQALARQLPEAEASDNFSSIPTDAEFYFIAVSDDKVAEVASQMPRVRGIVAHTSGSIDMDALMPHIRHGVFYPLQTFSKDAEIDLSQVPFLIEGSDSATTEDLKSLARNFAKTVIDADSELRAKIHVAAVFACNFPNFMWTCAAELLDQAGLDLSIFKPLLMATLDKALALGPDQAQTGPARRGDTNVIQRHTRSLPADKAEIYQLLSNCILQKYNK